MTAGTKSSTSTGLRVAKPVLATLTVVSVIMLVAFAARAWRVRTDAPAARRQNQAAGLLPPPSLQPITGVQRAKLPLPLQAALQAMGDRLERVGKERLVLLGTIGRPALSAARQPMRLILELPERLRLEEQVGSLQRVTVFNGASLARQDAAPDASDETLVEALVFDSVEHFFLGEMRGQATRFIGSNFRLDNGSSAGYTGPFYEIYETTDRVNNGRETREQSKHYYFNSKTLLLEKVRYRLKRGTATVRIELQIGGWKDFPDPQKPAEKQWLPTSLTRLEDGRPVLALSVTAASIVARVSDGIFTLPGR